LNVFSVFNVIFHVVFNVVFHVVFHVVFNVVFVTDELTSPKSFAKIERRQRPATFEIKELNVFTTCLEMFFMGLLSLNRSN
jgi:hypothetical protein